MQPNIKPTKTLIVILALSSISIFLMGVNALVNWDGYHIFDATCLTLPFFTGYVLSKEIKKIYIYYMLDLQMIFWVILAVLTWFYDPGFYRMLAHFMIVILFYSILKRKFNFILLSG